MQDEIAQLKTDTAQAQDVYQKIRDAYLDQNAVYLRKQTAFLDAQAGLLAQEKLRPGQPCPVCGSVEHPHPCTLEPDAQGLTRERIDALAETVRSLAKSRRRPRRMPKQRRSCWMRRRGNARQRIDSCAGVWPRPDSLCRKMPPSRKRGKSCSNGRRRCKPRAKSAGRMRMPAKSCSRRSKTPLRTSVRCKRRGSGQRALTRKSRPR